MFNVKNKETIMWGDLGTIEFFYKMWIRVVAGCICKLDTVIPRRIILNISIN